MLIETLATGMSVALGARTMLSIQNSDAVHVDCVCLYSCCAVMLTTCQLPPIGLPHRGAELSMVMTCQLQ